MKLAAVLFCVFVYGGVMSAYAESDISLWIPEHMIIGNSYQGVVISDAATPVGSLVLLSTGNDGIIKISDTVFISPYQNHGLFDVIPLAEGHAEVFAAYDGNLQNMSVQVFSPQSKPDSLKIVIPSNKTRADSMLGYAILLDNSGSPVPARDNISVLLSASSSGIGAPQKIIIKNNTYYSKFEMDVSGTGVLTASAESLKPHGVNIQKVQNEFTVKVAVAPDIAMQDSYVFYYVWLEKDGKPFHPPYAVDTILHSGDPDVARFVVNPFTDNSQGIKVRLVDGVAKGILYTGQRGYATITASIAEFGIGEDVLFVGPARLTNFDEDKNWSVALNQQDLTNPLENRIQPKPNVLMSWIYPSTTDGVAWGVVATYHINKTRSLDMQIDNSGKMSKLVTEDALVIPASFEGNTIYVSSNGMTHEGVHVIKQHITKTNALEFEVMGSGLGEYKVTVSGQGLESSDSKVGVVTGYDEDFEIGITAIPTIPFSIEDIAMISIFDRAGAMIDVEELFGADTEFLIHAGDSRARLPSDVLSPIYSNSAIVRGSLVEPTRITGISDGIGSDDELIIPSQIATSLEILAPSMVHVNEQFPFIVHKIDKFGNPLQKATDLRISSPLDVILSGDTMTLDSSGTGAISLVSDAGATEHQIVGVANIMTVDLDFENKLFRVGENLTINVINSIGMPNRNPSESKALTSTENIFLTLMDSDTDTDSYPSRVARIVKLADSSSLSNVMTKVSSSILIDG